MTGYKLYRTRQVESANPLGLVLLAYEALIQSFTRARSALDEGNVELQVEQTTRGLQALLELVSCLNHEQGGKIAGNLGSLYAYMYRRIMEGQNDDMAAALDEVLTLSQTLREGWLELSNSANENAANSAPQSMAQAVAA